MKWRGKKLAVGSRQSAVGRRKTEVKSQKSKVRSQKSEVGSRQRPVGSQPVNQRIFHFPIVELPHCRILPSFHYSLLPIVAPITIGVPLFHHSIFPLFHSSKLPFFHLHLQENLTGFPNLVGFSPTFHHSLLPFFPSSHCRPDNYRGSILPSFHFSTLPLSTHPSKLPQVLLMPPFVREQNLQQLLQK